MQDQERAPYERKLGCFVWRITYDFVRKQGEIYAAHGGCTNMDAATAFFEAIDPDILSVATFSDGKRDTVYSRIRGMEWAAFKPE